MRIKSKLDDIFKTRDAVLATLRASMNAEAGTVLNTIQMITAMGNVMVAYEPFISAITSRLAALSRQFGRCSAIAFILLGATFCAAVSTAQAQAYAVAEISTTAASGWLSSAPTKSSAASRFVLNTQDVARLGVYNSSFGSFTGANGRAERIRNAILNPGRFWLTPANQSADYGFLPTDSLPHASYLSLLEVRYQLWESNLAETMTLTDVNGSLVYPLVQIHYPTEHLPIALSIAPLRGSSDVR